MVGLTSFLHDREVLVLTGRLQGQADHLPATLNAGPLSSCSFPAEPGPHSPELALMCWLPHMWLLTRHNPQRLSESMQGPAPWKPFWTVAAAWALPIPALHVAAAGPALQGMWMPVACCVRQDLWDTILNGFSSLDAVRG